MTELNPAGSAEVYSTLYGGAGIENGHGIALDTAGNVYMIGTTGSTNLPVTPGVFQPQCGGGCSNDSYAFTDAFIAKFNAGSGSSPETTTTKLAVSPVSATVGATVTFTATVAPASGATRPTGTVTFKDGTISLGTGTLNGAGIATYSDSSLALGAHSITASYGGDSSDSASTSAAVALTIVGAVPAPPTGVTVTAGNSHGGGGGLGRDALIVLAMLVTLRIWRSRIPESRRRLRSVR